jgi:hypothetical protein
MRARGEVNSSGFQEYRQRNRLSQSTPSPRLSCPLAARGISARAMLLLNAIGGSKFAQPTSLTPVELRSSRYPVVQSKRIVARFGE